MAGGRLALKIMTLRRETYTTYFLIDIQKLIKTILKHDSLVMRLTPSLGNSSHNTKKTFNNPLLPRSLFFFDSVARPSVAVTRGRAQCRSPISPLPVSPPWAVKISLFGADAQATPGSLRVRPTPRRHPRQRLPGPTSTAPSQVTFFRSCRHEATARSVLPARIVMAAPSTWPWRTLVS